MSAPFMSLVCPHCDGTGQLTFTGSSLAERVKYLRALSGKSMREIPGISSAMICNIERGNITNIGADKVCALADAFQVPTDWILGRGVSA